jgi:hypothetical protein
MSSRSTPTPSFSLKSQPVAEPLVVESEPDEIVYRRVIDLGDGSGTQVFEAPTPEELIEKLATAQENATRKIRELTAAAHKPEPPAPVELNPDEEFVLSQEFLQSPTKAFAKLFQKNTGMTIEEFRAEQAKVTQLTRNSRDFNAGREFALAHRDDFYGSDRNIDRMTKWLKVEGLPATVENLAKAYTDLNESGLLESRPADQNDDEPTTRREAQPRIAAPVQKVVGQRRAASGLSSRGGSAGSPRSQEPTVDDLYKMPLDQLEALARKS